MFETKCNCTYLFTVVVFDFDDMESYEVDEGNNFTFCVQLVSGCLQRDAEVTVTSIEINGATG